ncbi:MAG: TonB-dependent receptor [Saprospiraceae bacterium]|nr:TonB-dependent receptor [Saprospiraceae bacterium]
MRFYFLSVILLMCIASLTAQSVISGTILDQNTAEPLTFVNVAIAGTAIGTSSDLNGKYRLEISPGTYSLLFSYVGYVDKSIVDIDVKDGEVTVVDLGMSDQAIELNIDLVVTAKSLERSENSVLLLRKKSDKIQDGISSQEMSRYGISNAAGAMRKVTGATINEGKYVYIRGLGDRYSLSQLNGLVIPTADPYRNSAQLDLIPTNLLYNIITSKTFTPDLPGTFTGGSVDIKTKSFPERFTLTFSASAGYNSQNNMVDGFLSYEGSSSDYFGYDQGSRDRPAIYDNQRVKELGILQQSLFPRPRDGGSGATEMATLTDQVIRESNNDFTPEYMKTPLDHGFSFSFGNQYGKSKNALGVILTGSFKQSYNHLSGYTKANWFLDDLTTGTLFNQGNFRETLSTQSPSLNGMAGLSYKLGSANTFSFISMYSHQTDKAGRFIEGERPDNLVYPRYLEGNSLIWTEREMVNFQLGGEHVLPGLKNARIEWKASMADMSQDEPDTRFFEYVRNVETDFYNLPASDIQLPFHFWRDLKDSQKDLKLDLTLPFGSNNTNKIKFGSLYSTKDRKFNEFRYQIIRESPFFFGSELLSAKSFSDVNGNLDLYLADDNIGIVDILDDSGTPEPRYIIGNRNFDVTIPRNSYIGSEDVFAGYGMLTLALANSLKFIGGARYEKTDISVESRDTFLDDDERFGNIDVSDILPSANLIFEVAKDMNLRASFSRTLARPNLREIANFSSFDPPTKSTISGNPNLERTNISNFDLRWEMFLDEGDLVSVSGYYKKFKNPITLFYQRTQNPTLQYTNVPSAELYGVEFELRKRLNFISPFFERFAVNTNFSFIEASSDVREENVTTSRTERPFEGQAPFIMNAALIYSASAVGGVEAVLALNTVGDRLSIFGRDNTPDVYNRGRSQLDFTISKKFQDLDLQFSAQNLLNNAYVLSSEYNASEYIYEKFQRGISFSVSMSYTVK